MSGLSDDFVVLTHGEADGNLEALPPHDIKLIRDWLNPTEYDDGTSEYIKHLRSHLGGTGDWIEQTSQYRQWHSGDDQGSRLLWLKAIAGAGKSVLAARTRARLSRVEDVPVLHFFFRHIITTNRTPLQLVRDWLAQLLTPSPYLQHQMEQQFLSKNIDLNMAAFDTLWCMLREALVRLPLVYCFADALDEMDLGNDTFVARLLQLRDIESCRVFVTSRPVPHIVAGFRNSPKAPIQITLGPDNMTEDIARYIDHRLEHDITRYIDHRLATSGVEFSRSETDGPTALIVRETLKRKVQGSFLYARLMTDNLIEAVRNHERPNKDDLRIVLDGLPTGLGDMYASMLQDHARRTATPWQLQLSILQWVTHSERPLRLLELAAVIDFQKESLEREKETKSIVRKACGPLLEILPSDVVGPIHHSFTEFLTTKNNNKHHIDSNATHRIMAEQCVKYLLHVCESETKSVPSRDAETVVNQLMNTQAIILQYPLISYAASSWYKHVQKCTSLDSAVLALLDRLFLTNEVERTTAGLALINWPNYDTDAASWLDARDILTGLREDHITALHIAATLGLHHYVKHLISLGQDFEAKDQNERTPIHCASQSGWHETVAVLLTAGADGDCADKDGYKPLHHAAMCDHQAAAKVLVDSGIDPATPQAHIPRGIRCGNGRRGYKLTSPIDEVCKAGCLDTLKVFLPFMDTSHFPRAVYHAISENKTELAMMLIALDKLEVNEEYEGNTLLWHAASARLITCMEALLQRGATVESRNHTKSLPIHAFASGREREPRHAQSLSEDEFRQGFEMLIAAGNDIEARDITNHTPLYHGRSSYSITKVLLDLGASMQSASEDDLTPLHRAADTAQMARLWIERGVDINARDDKGQTALMRSLNQPTDFGQSEQRVDDLLDCLLEHGADVSLVEHHGFNALHLSMVSSTPFHRSVGSLSRVSRLIRTGINVNARTKYGDTCLHLCRPVDVLEVLIKAGADLEARNRWGSTPLMKLACAPDSVRALINHGARVDARDATGRTCIHYFWSDASDRAVIPSIVKEDPLDALDILKSSGADPSWVDLEGNNAWHCLATRSLNEQRLPKALKAMNVEHDLPNLLGQTPVFLAVAAGNKAIETFFSASDLPFDINRPDIFGRTPFHLAACRSEAETKHLFELGAIVNARTVDGWTALHFAAQARQPNIVQYLLTQLTDDLISVKDSEGRTALDLAARSGIGETVDLLLEAAANRNDPSYASALEHCAQSTKEHREWERVREQVQAEKSHLHTKPVCTHIGRAMKEESHEKMVRILAISSVQSSEYIISIGRCIRRLFGAFRRTMAGPSEKVWTRASTASEEQTSLQYRYQRSLKRFRSTWEESSSKPLALDRTQCYVALQEALSEECWPMVEELLNIYQEESGDEDAMPLPSESAGRDVLASYSANLEPFGSIHVVRANMRQRLKDLSDAKRTESRTSFGSRLSRVIDLMPFLYVSECELWHPDLLTNVHNVPALRLVASGAHEILQTLGEKFKDERTFRPLPDSLRKNLDFYDRELITAFDEVPDVWDAVLLSACTRTLPSLTVVKVLLKHFPITAHGFVLAFFRLAQGNNAWHIEALNLLLPHVDINAQNREGQTALRFACIRRTGVQGLFLPQAIRCLLEHGADPNVLDNSGQSCFVPDLEIVDSMVAYGADVTLGKPPFITTVIRSGNIAVLKALIKQGVDLNKRVADDHARGRPDTNSSDDSYLDDSYPLHLAALMGIDNLNVFANKDIPRLEILQILLDGGAETNLILKGGEVLSHDVARRSGDPDLVAATLDRASLDLQLRGPGGQTYLLVLADLVTSWTRKTWNTPVRSLGLLHRAIDAIKRGADIKATDTSGKNILHLMLPGAPTTVLLDPALPDLMKRCQNHGLIIAADLKGNTPLQLCLQRQQWRFAELLVSFGADWTGTDPQGNNAFHHLAKRLMGNEWDSINYAKSSDLERAKARILVPRMPIERNDALLQEYVELERAIRLTTAKDEAEAPISRMIGILQGHPIDINALNHDGEPPIFKVIRSCPIEDAHGFDFLERMDLLTAAGANIHAKSTNGQGALHVLATRSPAQTFKQSLRGGKRYDDVLVASWKKLVAQGLDPYMEDAEQRTALDIAAVHGNVTILEMY